MTQQLPPGLMASSAVSWTTLELRNNFRHLLALIAERTKLSHDEAVQYVARRCGKSRNTVYAWLCDSDQQSPINWALMDVLRYEEAMLRSKDDKLDLSPLQGILQVYDPEWQARHINSLRKKVVRRAPRAA